VFGGGQGSASCGAGAASWAVHFTSFPVKDCNPALELDPAMDFLVGAVQVQGAHDQKAAARRRAVGRA
jgi:hypothetical protein